MAENDVQLDLKKRARRRLVGAIALALFAAIVLPMVMDSEPRPGSNELSIRIPSQEGGNFASQLIKGNAPPPNTPELPASSSAPLLVPSPVEMPPEDVAEIPASAPVASAKVAASSSSMVSSRQSSSRLPDKRSDEEQRARNILEGRAVGTTPAPASMAATGHVYVQLGVYKDESNARETANRATAVGVKVSLDKSGDHIRVRTAAMADRAAAEKIVERLKKAGLNGFLTSK